MAAALAHTHLVAHTCHMDVKPGNCILDDDSNLVLIDLEQSDTSGMPMKYRCKQLMGCLPKLSNVGNTKGPSGETCPRLLLETMAGTSGIHFWSGKNAAPKLLSSPGCPGCLLRQYDRGDFEGIENTEGIVED